MKTTTKLLLCLKTLLIISSCASKKKIITEKEYVTTIDTITVTHTIEKIKRFTDTLVVPDPCDEKGNLKPFNKKVKTEVAEVELINNNGNIEVKINIDSISNHYKSLYEKKYNSQSIEKSKVVEKKIVPFKFCLFLAISVIINIFLLKKIFL